MWRKGEPHSCHVLWLQTFQEQTDWPKQRQKISQKITVSFSHIYMSFLSNKIGEITYLVVLSLLADSRQWHLYSHTVQAAGQWLCGSNTEQHGS